MTHESRYWKTPLLRGATWLEKLVITDDSAERALARAEREVFIGFYAVRKLLATFKLSESTKTLKLELEWFAPKSGVEVDYFHRTDVDELFDLETPYKEARDVGFVCNQVVHSYVFVPQIGEHRGLDGFYLASDTMRKRRLYFIPLAVVVSTFRTVGRDYPSGGHYVFNENTGDWEAKRGAA